MQSKKMIPSAASLLLVSSLLTSAFAATDPLIVLDASGLTLGADLAAWPNTGTLGGTFDRFTGGVGPEVAMVAGKKAVNFVQPDASGSSRRTLASTLPAPTALSGNNPWTISTTIYRSATQPGGENSYMQWAGGSYENGQSAIFCYVNNLAYIHWGTDSGFQTMPSAGAWHNVTITFDGANEIIYVDGAFDRTTPRTLSINPGGLMIVGGRTWHDLRGEDQYWRFNGAISSLKIFASALTAQEVAALLAIPKHTITITGGAGGTISPSGTGGELTVDEGDNPTFTIMPSLGYKILNVLVDEVSNPDAVTSGSYTFNNVTTNHTIAATFELLPKQLVSGKVTDGTSGILGANVYFKTSANASVNPTFTTNTVDAAGNYSMFLPPGNWYVTATEIHYFPQTDTTFSVASSPVAVPDIVLTPNPNWALLFSLNTDHLSAIADGARIATWEGFQSYETYNNEAPLLGPTVQVIDGVKWEKNVVANYNDQVSPTIHARGDGFNIGTFASGILSEGVTIVAVIKPEFKTFIGEQRGEIVDIFYGELFLATKKNTGEVIVCTRGYIQRDTGYIIPDGQKTVLSLVVKPNGDVELFANGESKWTYSSGADYSSLMWYGTFDKITVGRNAWDGWSAFNGNIGDVYVFKTALDDRTRQTLQANLAVKFGIPGVPFPPPFGTKIFVR